MYYVYVLQSVKDKDFYTGFTIDLDRRIKEHNQGLEVSTKSRTPLNLVYFEWCLVKKDAIIRERYLKSGTGKKYIRNRLKYYFASVI